MEVGVKFLNYIITTMLKKTRIELQVDYSGVNRRAKLIELHT